MRRYDDGTVTVHHGDCIQVMRTLPDGSIDAVVTDPPYGLEFMGKDWDKFRYSNTGPQHTDFKNLGALPTFSPNRRNQKCPACGKWAYDHPGRKCECGGWKQPAQLGYALGFQQWCTEWATEALRVLKPGGHLVAFGGTRTWHRLACAIEDAGFEIRDALAWMYGSGFPKSLDVSKAIDKAAGATREVVGTKQVTRILDAETLRKGNYTVGVSASGGTIPIIAPATDAARQWQGWGTALKPAYEPIVLARKPLTGTVAANVLDHGTGALNIDGCRIGTDEDTRRNAAGGDNGMIGTSTFKIRERRVEDQPERAGRWPANVLLDADAAAMLDAQSGVSRDGVAVRRHGVTGGEIGPPGAKAVGTPDMGYGGEGGASRFFYTSKAGRDERPTADGVAHPTVKPLDLMQWLVRLVTPPGGVVLDPFAGSGTTAEACIVEGFRCIAVEMTADYLPLIVARLSKPIQPTLGADL